MPYSVFAFDRNLTGTVGCGGSFYFSAVLESGILRKSSEDVLIFLVICLRNRPPGLSAYYYNRSLT